MMSPGWCVVKVMLCGSCFALLSELMVRFGRGFSSPHHVFFSHSSFFLSSVCIFYDV